MVTTHERKAEAQTARSRVPIATSGTAPASCSTTGWLPANDSGSVNLFPPPRATHARFPAASPSADRPDPTHLPDPTYLRHCPPLAFAGSVARCGTRRSCRLLIWKPFAARAGGGRHSGSSRPGAVGESGSLEMTARLSPTPVGEEEECCRRRF